PTSSPAAPASWSSTTARPTTRRASSWSALTALPDTLTTHAGQRDVARVSGSVVAVVVRGPPTSARNSRIHARCSPSLGRNEHETLHPPGADQYTTRRRTRDQSKAHCDAVPGTARPRP